MANRQRKPDVEEVDKDPTTRFASPMDVVNDPRLTPEEKHQILESWARDAEQISQAESENMTGPGRSRLQEVKLALLELEKRRQSA